jgi:tetratricopeptide (TPR) repeat protein
VKLIKDDVFYTKTMAKVYADQGNLEKAAEIYKYLLKREPSRHDLTDALSEIEKKSLEKDSERLEKLFGKWVDLLIKYNGLQKLKKFQRCFNDGS